MPSEAGLGRATPGLRMGTPQARWVLAGTIAGSGMAMLDGTVVNVALARIGAEFDAGFTSLQWITNAYTLSLASLILLGGVLGDSFGRRRVFMIGVVWFTVASVLCAFSPSVGVLIGARALQGVGAALLTPGSLSIISATFDPADRSRAVGAWSGLGGVATAIGPLLGGWLTDVNWRLVFAINVPLAALVIWTAIRHMPETRDTDDSTAIDLPGTLSVVVALCGLTYALTTVGAQGWSGPVVAAGLVGLGAGVVFVLIERRVAHPLVHLGLFADRTFAVTNIVTVFVYAGLSVYFFLMTLQLQLVSGWTPLSAGLSMLPVTIVMLALSARFGALSDKVGPRPLMAIGTLLAAGGFALALRVGPEANYLADVLPAVLCLAFGLACCVAPLTSAVLGAAPANQAGAASGINNAVARSAGLLAVAVIPAVAGLSRTGTGGADQAAAFGRGFDAAMLIGAGLLVIGSAISWFALRGCRGLPASTDEPDASNRVAVHQQQHCPVQGPAAHPADRH